MKYGVSICEIKGPVAVKEIMGTWVLLPISEMKSAWLDFCGPRIALTLSFFKSSMAAKIERKRSPR